MQYNFKHIEKKWQQHWHEHNIFAAGEDRSAPKYFVMDLMPLPTEKGLQIKDLFGFFTSDVLSRYKKMNGCNVLHPIGFLAHWHFAEKYAKELGKHPSDIFNKNVKRYHKQLKSAGIVFHPSRELNTWDPDYYKWAQWVFIRLFQHYYDIKANKALPIERLIDEFGKNGNRTIEAPTNWKTKFTAEEWKKMDEKQKQEVLMHYRLAYTSDIYVNWCPKLNRYLDADEVKGGFSIKGNHPVERFNTKQWLFRMAAYAERLWDGLEKLNQPEEVKRYQQSVFHESEEKGAGKKHKRFYLNDFFIGSTNNLGISIPVQNKNGIISTCDEKELPFMRSPDDLSTGLSKQNPAINQPLNTIERPDKEPIIKTLSNILETFVYPYRIMDIGNSGEMLSKEAAAYWQKPDVVIVQTYHEKWNLLYLHFLHKFLYDTGIVSSDLPFDTLIDSRSCFIPTDDYYEHNKIPKPENNIIDYDTLLAKHGADALRMGVIHNYGQSGYNPRPWDSESLKGAELFLTKLWELYHDDQGRLCISDENPEENELEIIHETIKAIIECLEEHRLRNAISHIMNGLNELREAKCNKREILKTLAIIISPFAPHIAEELWELTGDNKKSVFEQPFPIWEKKHLRKTAIYPVCFNGKTVFKTELSLELSREEVEIAILNLSETKKLLKGKKPKRVIVVPGKIVNIVI